MSKKESYSTNMNKGQKQKTCKYCHALISPGTKYCSVCGKRQGGKAKWVILIIVVIFIFIVVVGNIGSSNSSSSEQKETEEVLNTPAVEDVKRDLSVEEAVIYEGDDNIIKTTGEITDGTSRVEVELYIENNSAFNLEYALSTYAVNGIMSDNSITFLTAEIAAGKKGYVTLDISKSWLKENGIDEIQYIDIIIYGYDSDTFSVELESDIVRIETSFYDGTLEFADGTEIYNNGALLVKLLSLNDDTIKFSVTNISDVYVELYIKNVSVNDWALDTGWEVYSQVVFPSSTGIYELEFDSDFKQKSSIETVSDVEFALEVCTLGKFLDEYSTDVIHASRTEP